MGVRGIAVRLRKIFVIPITAKSIASRVEGPCPPLAGVRGWTAE